MPWKNNIVSCPPCAFMFCSFLISLSLITFPGSSGTIRYHPFLRAVWFYVMLVLNLIQLFNSVLQYLQQQKQHPLQNYVFFPSSRKGTKLHCKILPLFPRFYLFLRIVNMLFLFLGITYQMCLAPFYLATERIQLKPPVQECRLTFSGTSCV